MQITKYTLKKKKKEIKFGFNVQLYIIHHDCDICLLLLTYHYSNESKILDPSQVKKKKKIQEWLQVVLI